MKIRVGVRYWQVLTMGFGLTIGAAHSQIATDGTVGSAQSLTGPNYAIGAGLGTQRGANLFHSFSTFNIHTGESATFSGPNGLQNVISRVTGGTLSNIDGLLRSEINGANVWFINPAGVVFGVNAQLDVPAAFHVSTADELRFADGAVFSAANPGISTLSSEPVAAFGFTSAAPKRIEVNGSYLSVKEGQTLSLVGGDINLSNATIYAPAGRLNIASVGSAGEVVPTETDLELRGFGALGTLTMWHDPEVEWITMDIGEPFGEVKLADLDTSGVGGGAMFIRGGNWLNHGGSVFADTYGSQTGQGVSVGIAGEIQFDVGAQLTADTSGSSAGGAVTVTADNLTLLNGGVVAANTWGGGNAGSVTIHAGNLLVNRQGSPKVTGIFSNAYPGSTGAGGSVNLDITDTLSLINGSQISAATFAQGDAGSVAISAGNLLVDGQGSEYLTGITGSADRSSTGAGGSVNLDIADTLSLLNGGEIGANTFAQGDAGTVAISAGNLLVDAQGSVFFTGIASSTFAQGNAGLVTIRAGNLLVDGQGSETLTGIASSAESHSSGAGGSVNLDIADTLSLLNNSVIRSNTSGAGDAGSVTIKAKNLLVDSANIASSAYPDSSGAGGNINLDIADTLTILNGGEISAATFAQGDAGTVTINAGNLLVDRQDSPFLTGIASSANSDSTGAGGNVNVTVADTLSLLNGGVIRASTFAQGDAGTVTISAGNLLVDAQDSEFFTGISSSAEPHSSGAGGNINLTVADTLSVLHGGEIRAATFAEGDAGTVTISAGNLLVDRQGSEFLTGISSDASTGSTGTGGDVNLTVADTFTLRNGAEINVQSAGGGTAGNLTLTTPALIIDGGGIFATSDQTTGGKLFINAADLRLLNRGQISTSVFGDATTTGGNVEINSRTVVALDGSTVTAKAKQGKGGNILVNTDVFLHDAPSIDDVLNASSESTVTGNQGSVTVNTALDPGRSIVGITRRLGDLNDANPDPCARRKGIKKSTLTQVGRGGLPADNRPEGMTTSLSGGDWTPPVEPAEPAPSGQEPLTLNADRDDCRL